MRRIRKLAGVLAAIGFAAGLTMAGTGTARAAVAIPELASAPVLGIEVGLRPGRPQVRLEAEQTGGTAVIHDYGHDGTGVFWSWGCAADVVALCGLG